SRQRSRIARRILTSRFPTVAAHLLLVAASCQIANSYCTPAQFSHKLRQASKGAGGPVALWHFKQVQQRLSADALQPIKEVNPATNALKREAPRISGFCRCSFRGFLLHPFPE